MGEDKLEIEVVGKWLIHYRQYTAMNKKLPTRFAARDDLQKLLSSNKAVLLEQHEVPSKPLNSRAVRPGRSVRPSRATCERLPKHSRK